MRHVLLLALLAACATDTTPGVAVLHGDRPQTLNPSIEARIDELLAEMTLEQKIAQLSGSSILPVDGIWPTPSLPELGVPGFRMVDGPRGCAAGVSTVFPVAMARAASWDPALEQRVGGVMGHECAAHGADVILAPAMNLVSHPAYGRAQENYGEDPWLTGRMAVGFVKGAQRHVMASAKHYAANNLEDSRFYVDARLDPRTLREVYLPHFRAVVREAEVWSVMAAYNRVNGDFCTENEPLLTGILREDWGFRGFVESDWAQAVHDTKRALEAGLDLEMPVTRVFEDLGVLVASGQIAESTVDAAVRRLLRAQLSYDRTSRPRPDAEVIASAEHVALAREVAAAGTVLLKNDGGVIPFADDLASVAVVGRLADVENTGDVGSSRVEAPYVVTPIEGLTAALGAERVVAVATDTPDAGQLAAVGDADVAVVVVGLTSEDEGENIPGRPGGDRDRLGLRDEHVALIDAVTAVHDRVVVVLVGGSAITVEGWVDDVEGLLQPWYGGMEGGSALADVLTGAVPPTGRMPLTVPTGPEQLPPFDPVAEVVEYAYLHGYRHVDRAGLEPRFPFGFGLSTTTFALEAGDGWADGVPIEANGTSTRSFTVTVRNTGTRRGAEVVQLYAGPQDAALGLPDRVLVDFEKVWLDPGEARDVTLQVDVEQLATWDEALHAFVVAPGIWDVAAGTSSRDLPLTTTLPVDTTPVGMTVYY